MTFMFDFPKSIVHLLAIIFIFSSNILSSRDKLKTTIAYSLGIGACGIWISIYNILNTDFGMYGLYGDLYDPISDSNINSPKVAAYVLIGMSILVGVQSTFRLPIFIKLIVYGLIAVHFGVIALLNSRTSQALSFLFIIYLLISSLSLKNLIKSPFIYSGLSLLMLCVILYLFYFTELSIISEIQGLNFRLNSDGLSSSRFSMWIEGVKNLFIHPFGWDKKSIYPENWYHNIILDSAANAGILAVIFIMILIYMSCYNLYTIGKSNTTWGALYLVLITVVIIHLTDVIVDGAIRLFYLLIILGLIRIKHFRKV